MQISVSVEWQNIFLNIEINFSYFLYEFAVNINNVVGAIGFVSKIIPSVYPISIIKADPASGDPIRDSNGLCQVRK